MRQAHFAVFADYNAWANARLYAAAAALPAAAQDRPQPAAFFGSLLGTLSHILVADRMWMSRFLGEPSPYSRLDERPCADLAALAAERQAEDRRILDYVGGLDDATLAGELVYRTVAGQSQRNPLWHSLAHFFNHQTHHRGQAHALLSAAGSEPPPLDLIYCLRERRTA